MIMKRLMYYTLGGGLMIWLQSCFFNKPQTVANSESITPPASVYDISLNSLDGKSVISLAQFRGKKIMIVNTASECGFTPQYENLQKLSEQYKDKLVLLGCPCNQFGLQEPGDSSAIRTFCTKNYGVTFQMTEKLDVKGANQHPLYQWLTSKAKNGSGDYEVKWNFNKFLIDENGHLMGYFPSSTDPLSSEITSLIQK